MSGVNGNSRPSPYGRGAIALPTRIALEAKATRPFFYWSRRYSDGSFGHKPPLLGRRAVATNRKQTYSGATPHPVRRTETLFMKAVQLGMRITVITVTLMVGSASAFASCYTNTRGRVVCNNGEQAGGYNAHTGTAWKSERNSNGVATTQTSRGGEAKTKNGKGVYQSPNGKDCYKSANGHGCN